MPYTTHGHWFGEGEPSQPAPKTRARCGGPSMCGACKMDVELSEILANPDKGIALSFGDTISNGAHVLAYTGIHSETKYTKAIALCWWPFRHEYAVWTIEYVDDLPDKAAGWYAEQGRYPGRDFARALLIYTQRCGSNVNLPNFIR